MITAILQVRVSSTRLPGKVLMPILGRPMLGRQIERVRRSQQLQGLLVATSVDPSDDPIVTLCEKEGVEVYRGALDDVLDRFYQAARSKKVDPIVRLTGDCPLLDPPLIDQMIIQYNRGGSYDYLSNTLDPTFPDGLDVEIIRFSALEKSWMEATRPSEREHVTAYVHQHPDRFRLGSFKNPIDLSHLRWTVDEAADFELVRKIYEALYPSNPAFSTQDILTLLDSRPEWKTLNASIPRNEGYQKSKAQDAVVDKLSKRSG
jgi:spore coat polysaccharide biosynthesis protein SpsF